MKHWISGPAMFILLFTIGVFLLIPNTSAQQDNCDPSYPEVCIPTFPRDLNCGDISDRRFAGSPLILMDLTGTKMAKAVK